ncbi:MAG: WD40 repeat domain-containing protein [Muribaculaceae bacterium]|nr:WD40 repeat domain-containing protein [Muribaculaceae bacterium]
MKHFLLSTGLLLGALITIPSISFAQEATQDGAEENAAAYKTYNFRHQESPITIQPFFTTAYTAGKHELATMSGAVIQEIKDTVINFMVNPAGLNLAVVRKNKKNITNLDIVNPTNGLISFSFNTKKFGQPTAAAYMPDARQLAVAAGGKIYLLETKKYLPVGVIECNGFEPRMMITSPNGYYLAAINGNKVVVYNIEQRSIRWQTEEDDYINDIAFSPNTSDFAVLTSDGVLYIYNTRTFDMRKLIDNLGKGLAVDFNFDGKYVAVVTEPNVVTLVNLVRDTEREYFEMPLGGVADLTFISDSHRNTLLATAMNNNVEVRRLPNLEPFYSQLIQEEVDRQMEDWMRKMPDETMEEYQARVNQESINKRRRLLEDEISTNFAGDLLAGQTMTFGSYDRNNGVLALNFNEMPTIFLNVPEEDVLSFSDPSLIKFSEVQYGILPDDTFEIVYARVENTATGKSYIYDNLMRETMDFMNSEDISLELLQQQQMEEMKLQELREQVVEEAKQQDVISDHTNISVNSKVVPDYDANGNKILNYEVNFTYEVEPEFSAQEDFKPGKYHVDESGAASAMLKIVKQAFEGDMSQYLKDGKKLKINLVGTADATPIINGIAYDGAYGEIEDEPVYLNDQLTTLTVTKKSGIKENPQLALVRALGVQDFLEKNVEGLDKMNKDYRYDVKVSEGKGSEFRRITATFTFVDAF